MGTELLYMNDCYLREFDARVLDVRQDEICLDRTAFYPQGGGLPSDTGVIRKNEEEYRVTDVRKEGNTVWHNVPGHSLAKGDEIRGIIDWDKRYRVMRMHTALHALIAIMNEKYGVLVTGNKISPERSRVDVNLEKPDREMVKEAIEETNRVLAKGIPVKIYYLPREEAMKIPGIVKLAKALPPNVDKLRIVEIEGVDIQADGGPHVANTKEVGKIIFLKLENKGKNNRRIHFTLEP